MVNIEILRWRINRPEEYLRILSRISRYSYEEFIEDPERYGRAERFLQLAIAAINDLGNHVIADPTLGEISWIQMIVGNIVLKHGHDLKVFLIRTP